MRRRRPAGGNSELGGRGVVHQQEIAVLVLNRDAGREHPEHIPQQAQLEIVGARVIAQRRRGVAGRAVGGFA